MPAPSRPGSRLTAALCRPFPCANCSLPAPGRGKPAARLLLLLLLSWFLPGYCSPAATAAEARYMGRLRDGKLISADEITGWHEAKSTPALAGQPLTGAGAAVRWVVDTATPVSEPSAAFVEFAGGDRLPGKVASWETPQPLPGMRGTTHLLVETAVPLDTPGRAEATFVRVNLNWARRIVWSRIPGNSYRPATLFFRDGRQIDFRSLRWMPEGIQILTTSGVETVLREDLAELHLPARDPWDAWFEQLGVLASGPKSELMQIETADGLVACCSQERAEPFARGKAADPENWYQQIQPAWSLDPLWIRHRSIRAWRFFAVHEMPLTVIEPSDIERRAAFSAGWKWQRDRNVYGKAASTAESPVGWCLGVHAWCRLTFPLHTAVRSCSLRAGLDRSVGEGGCVRLEVAQQQGEAQLRRLYRSPVLKGSADVVETGSLHLQSSSSTPSQLILLADSVDTGQPPGADPFDIRDAVNWISPLLTLDPEAVQQELNQRRFGLVPSLAGWTAEPAPATTAPAAVWQTSSRRDETVPGQPEYRLLLSPAMPFGTFSRSIRFGRRQRWLAVHAGRPERGSPPVTLQIEADGQVLCEFPLPEFSSNLLPAPVLVPVPRLAGKTARIRVVLIPDEAGAAVDFRGIAAASQPPGLLQLFEDEEQILAIGRDDEGTVELARLPEPHPPADSPMWKEDTRAVFSGSASLVVHPPGASAETLPGLSAAIREFPQPGEYRYLCFAWKKQGGGHIGLELASDGQFFREEEGGLRPDPAADFSGGFVRRRLLRLEGQGLRTGYRYVAGPDLTLWPTSLRLTPNTPDKWQFTVRDLFADCGSMTLTGLGFLCPDGQSASFDHLWLARTREDLNLIRQAPAVPPALFAPEVPPDPAAPGPNGEPLSVTDPLQSGRAVGLVAPRFSLAGTSLNIRVLPEFRGRQQVLEITATGKPAPLLRSAVNVPEKQKLSLRLVAGHSEGSEWRLRVRAAGTTLLEQKIDEQSAPEGWLEQTVEIGRFAGQSILLEVEAEPLKGQRSAFLHRLELVSPE